jgi:hypothetical protein
MFFVKRGMYMGRKQQAASIIRDNSELINKLPYSNEFFLKFQDERLVRCAAHFVIDALYKGNLKEADKFLVEKSVSGINLKIYSKDAGILDTIKSAINNTIDFYSVLIAYMKKHHTYVDYDYSSTENITIFIFIDKRKKNITTDTDLNYSFDRFSNLLLAKAASEEATFMDIFFLLAYHTVDSIKVVPQDEMPKIFEQSIQGLQNRPSESEIKRAIEQNEVLIERKPHISELLGCYVDYSNQNCSISEDNNVICICKENIIEFGLKFNISSYSLMFNLVFAHEFGHLVFSYLDYENTDRKLSEGRANFFASYLMSLIGDNKDYDQYIKKKTDKQPDAYKSPILFSNSNWKDLLKLEIF